VGELVRRAALAEGLTQELPDGLGEQEATRQADLARLVRLAEEAGEDGTVGAFVEDLRARFASEGDGRGVNLLTYHRAKGLEFDAVFLPHLEEGEMPFKRSKSDEALTEERRLLYVGITRARTYLYLTWTLGGKKPSRFLGELAAGTEHHVAVRREDGEPRQPKAADGPLLKALKAWRLERSRTDDVPAYVVFHDKTLVEIAAREPRSLAELASIAGVGPAKLDRYGPDVLGILSEALGS
jgi:DNA helicase-2/ATP-dependent DNA helicase PcrA